MAKRRNPKISSKSGKAPPKPPKPSDLDVPEAEIDHTAGAEDAYKLGPQDGPKGDGPLVEEAEEDSGGVGAPPAEELPPGGVGEPVAKKPPPQDIQKPEEGDPGKLKKVAHVRGLAPGTRITY